MSEFDELRDLALKLTEEIQTGALPLPDIPSVKGANAGAFITDVEQRLKDLYPGRNLTPTERELLTYVFSRNKTASPAEVAERLAWIAKGPNAFYWGPWLPFQP